MDLIKILKKAKLDLYHLKILQSNLQKFFTSSDRFENRIEFTLNNFRKAYESFSQKNEIEDSFEK